MSLGNTKKGGKKNENTYWGLIYAERNSNQKNLNRTPMFTMDRNLIIFGHYQSKKNKTKFLKPFKLLNIIQIHAT